MTLLTNALLFSLSLAVLLTSGSFFINSMSTIARAMKINEFVFSFFVVGIATSLPELFVGINAALVGKPLLAVGNVVGSNIANLTLIVGLPVLLARSLTVSSKTMKRDCIHMIVLAAIPFVLMLIGGGLSRFDAILLLLVFTGYIFILLRQRREFRKTVTPIKKSNPFVQLIIFLVSGVLLYLSAQFTITYATGLSLDLGVPELYIGIFVLAIGTSLPELTVGLQAARKKNEEILLGNIVGSVVANSTLVLGGTLLISPVLTGVASLLISFIILIIVTILFSYFVLSGGKFDWKEGIILVMVYILFLIVETTLGVGLL